jgi:uncharacterized delta-60 repeat protein
MKRFYVTTWTLLLLTLVTNAYSQNQKWMRRYGYILNGADQAQCVGVDASGNVYVTGYGTNGANDDIITLKYNSVGTILWAQRYNGGSSDTPKALRLDTAGNVYITGIAYIGSTYDYVTLKYSTAGVLQWIKRYNGGGDDEARAIDLDTSGNVYVTGFSHSGGYKDIVTLKYDNNGTSLWAQRYNGAASKHDQPTALKIDSLGNIYIAGTSDSGGTSQTNILLLKYNSSGSRLWAKTYTNINDNQNDTLQAMALDSAGNVVLTGYLLSTGGILLKYTPAGTLSWSYQMSGVISPTGIGIDGSDNIYVISTVVNSDLNLDYLTQKYNPAGTLQWGMRYNGGSDDNPYAIAVDSSGNAYVTGSSKLIRGGGTTFDIITIKYNSAGAGQWARRYSATTGTEASVGLAIATDGAGNAFVAGYTIPTASSSPDYITIKYGP